MNRKFQSSEVGSRITTNSLLKTVTDWGNRVTTYEYYPDGRLSKITRPNSTVRTQQYALDGRLSRAEERTSSGHVIALYQYNYNKNGTLESRFAVPLPQPYKLPEKTFTYDNDNRIATHNAAAVTYDVDGNLLQRTGNGGQTTTYQYDARNRLTQTSNLQSQVSYTYDVFGNRIGMSENGTNTTCVVNPASSLSQVLVREKNGQKMFYVYGLGLEYEVSQSGAVRYYHYDQLGSTVALSDGAGQVTDRMEYSPYGTVTHRTGANDTPFLYVGKYGVQTDGNGLLYMRARYYSPLLSRFLNSDPIGLGGGLNFFAYANGNPVSFTDPLGNAPQVVMVNNSGKLVNSGYSGDRDWGQWDPNWGGKGFLPPAPEYEVAIVAVPVIAFAVVTAPEWGPVAAAWGTRTGIQAQMLAGGVGSMALTRTQQFAASNPWAVQTWNAVRWLIQDVSNPMEVSKVFAGRDFLVWGRDQIGGFFNSHFSGPEESSASDHPVASFVDNAELGPRNNSQKNNSLESQVTTTPVGGTGAAKKP